MSKQNFATMSKSELRRYVLTHRTDTEAFHALMDRINAEPNQKFYTVDEIDVLQDLIEAKRHTQENQ